MQNKGELPTKLMETRGSQENTSIFAFQDSATLVSYCVQNGVDIFRKQTGVNVDPSGIGWV